MNKCYLVYDGPWGDLKAIFLSEQEANKFIKRFSDKNWYFNTHPVGWMEQYEKNWYSVNIGNDGKDKHIHKESPPDWTGYGLDDDEYGKEVVWQANVAKNGLVIANSEKEAWERFKELWEKHEMLKNNQP